MADRLGYSGVLVVTGAILAGGTLGWLSGLLIGEATRGGAGHPEWGIAIVLLAIVPGTVLGAAGGASLATRYLRGRPK